MFNFGAQVIVERKPNQWEDARTVYLQMALKGKMFVADEKFDNRTFVVIPKGIQIPTLKIMKGEEEQFLEQMLAQSMIGYQLDNIKKYMNPAIIPLKKFNNPKELSCLGFNLTNVFVKVNKGFLQLNANYIDVAEPVDEAACEVLKAALRKDPTKLVEDFKDLKGIKDLTKTLKFMRSEEGKYAEKNE